MNFGTPRRRSRSGFVLRRDLELTGIGENWLTGRPAFAGHEGIHTLTDGFFHPQIVSLTHSSSERDGASAATTGEIPEVLDQRLVGITAGLADCLGDERDEVMEAEGVDLCRLEVGLDRLAQGLVVSIKQPSMTPLTTCS